MVKNSSISSQNISFFQPQWLGNELLVAAEDAHTLASAEVDQNGTLMMNSHLAADERVEACTILLDNLPETVTGNCWLAVDAEPMEREGIGEIPP